VNSALAGYANILAFIFTFISLAGRHSWKTCLAAGILASIAVIVLVFNLHLSSIPAAAVAWFSLAASILFISRFPHAPDETPLQVLKHPALVQGAAALVVVVLISCIAQIAGPHYSGLFAALPSMWTILYGFTHAHGGKPAVIALARGAIMSNTGYLAFLTVMSFARIDALVPLFAVAFATTLVTACLANILARQGIDRSRKSQII
jgi:hypothetical protein